MSAQAVTAPVSANLRVSLWLCRQAVTNRAGRTTSIVSLVSTAVAAAMPAPKWCHRCLLGEAASAKASSVHITARLSRKISRWRTTDSGERPKRAMASPAAQRGRDMRRAMT